jgi:hypothetical protein
MNTSDHPALEMPADVVNFTTGHHQKRGEETLMMPSGVLLQYAFVYKVGSMEWKKLLLRAVIGKTYEQTNNL